MARAPFQVLVIPYRFTSRDQLEYALLLRDSPRYGEFWQPVAGGGEDEETPLEAAQRESLEETGLSTSSTFIPLDSSATIPAPQAAGMLWGPDVLVIPEHAFGVNAGDAQIRISAEHLSFRWVAYATAQEMLHFDSNKNALWELDFRLKTKAKRI